MTEKREELKALKKKYREDKRAIKTKYARNPQKVEERRLARAERRRAQKELTEKMPKRYSIGEEIFNSVSHGVGAGLSIAAIVLLVVRAVLRAPAGETSWYVVSYAVFGASLFLLYLMSTLYHALTPYNVKNVFAVFDHSSIYILIAGTYTPYCFTAMNRTTGWVMFGIIWGLAIFGVTMYAVFGNKMRLVSAITYLPMGMLILFALKQLLANMPLRSVVLLLAGGACYIAGWPFYMMKKKKWMHCIFHLFVLAGSILHFFSIYLSI
jgi:hemolysin III